MSDVEVDDSATASRAASADPFETDSSLSTKSDSGPFSDDPASEDESSAPLPKRKGKEHVSEESDNDEDEEDQPMNGSDSDEYEELTKKEKAAKKSKGKRDRAKEDAKAAGIPYDPVYIPPGDKTSIEKLISWRIQDGKEEILVKYKNMSYYHTEWVSRAACEEGKTGKQRVKRFLDKPIWETQWSDDEPFNPNFTKIDRLLDEGELHEAIYYLVKWCGQTYDMSTWEDAKVVKELDGSKIEEFNARRTLNSAKQSSYKSSGKRPNPNSWKKLDESPIYKNENQLRPYQLEGLNWLMFCWYHRQNSILADEMGLGKTVQSTIFLHHLYVDQNVTGPFLIVTPLSTIGNWEREIKTWTDMNVVVYHGRDVSRNLIVDTEFFYRDEDNRIVPNVFKFDIILTTYEMAMSGVSQLRPIKWKCVVLDEAHRLKNKASKVSEILKTYKMDHRVLLTGTPLQNSLDELWSLLNFLEPEQFSSEKEFQMTYGNLKEAGDVERLQGLLKPLMLRRLKEDVEKSIPVKEETIIEVELTTVQKKWYRSILERNFSWLKQGGKKNNVPNLINTMIELRKCCIHPFLLKGAEEQIIKETGSSTLEKQFDLLVQASGKMVLIDKLLKKLRAGGHKVLIFSQMTRCLDLIQDYLRGSKWGFERIDGGVRGDLRQAAIDRFSKPDSDTFVFLLCTRAGGVGINLTAADTDWNPQNDLQAQSRCHRIGQKKPVQIYRLITRNTYEREMFDRASMKLGLDKAILQRMDAQNLGSGVSLDTTDPSKPPSSLSKTEIEELLKKGAYGAFMDDDASKEFCEEDIDRILERRTQVIRHDASEEKSSIFSKASFTTSNDNLDIDDPDFWDKMAKKANLEVVDATAEENLIIDLPRQRRPVQRFGGARRGDISRAIGSEDEEYDPSKARGGPAPDGSKPWTTAERTRLERLLMMHGLGNWDLWPQVLNRRQAEDIKACAHAIVAHCLRLFPEDKAEMMKDSRKALFLEGVYNETDVDPGQPMRAVPYEGATPRQCYEFRSLLEEAPPEYMEHLQKKARNLLSRIAMMHVIRHKIAPMKEMEMPWVSGKPPVSWWGEEADRDILIGICKHGYQRYDKIRMDPELCFYNLTFDQNGEAPPDAGWKDEDEDDDMKDEDDVKEEKAVVAELDEEDENEDVAMEGTPAAEGANGASGTATPTGTLGEGGDRYFPTASEIGGRLRRILTACTRELNAKAREEAKRAQALERDAKLKAREEVKERKANKQQDRELSKKEKGEFYKTLMSFGVDRKNDGSDECNWTRFQQLAQLQHKSPQVLDTYYLKLLSMCEEVIAATEAAALGNVPEPDEAALAEGDEDGAAARNQRLMSVKTLERDGDQVTYDKAKKILKRLEQMRTLREYILPHAELDQRLVEVKRHGRSGLPRWWTAEHDKAFLFGISKHGLLRPDLLMEDKEFGFYDEHQEWIKSMDIRKEQEIPPDELVDGKWADKFWMREGVSLRRFEALCDAVRDPVPAKAAPPMLVQPTTIHGKTYPPILPKRETPDTPQYTFQSDNDLSFRNFKPIDKTQTPSSSYKFKVTYDNSPHNSSGSPHFTPEPLRGSGKRKRSSKHKKAKKERKLSDVSGDDTDDMLNSAQKVTKSSKRRRKERHNSDLSELEDFPRPKMEMEDYVMLERDYQRAYEPYEGRYGLGASSMMEYEPSPPQSKPKKEKKHKHKRRHDRHEHRRHEHDRHDIGRHEHDRHEISRHELDRHEHSRHEQVTHAPPREVGEKRGWDSLDLVDASETPRKKHKKRKSDKHKRSKRESEIGSAPMSPSAERQVSNGRPHREADFSD
ncbi:choline dehydrogenase 7 [Rhizophlyctis rosea]|uniref:Choline dehydrogenase 7 n=1 Tax=Rhizophlyctis rosea TaxID=64517 RepID=A0AAD5SFS6_9FUNG|nr:choline dehydrogenase 7 [Rhizophlyctis rosea]